MKCGSQNDEMLDKDVAPKHVLKFQEPTCLSDAYETI